jgi:hypothetical protein
MFPDGQVALSSVTMTGMPALGGSTADDPSARLAHRNGLTERS